MHRDSPQQAKWFEEARLGMFQAFAFHRRILQADAPLSRDERAALVDLLCIMEEYMDRVWQVSTRSA